MMTNNPARRWSRRLLAATVFAGLIGAVPPAAGGTIGISGGTLIAGAGPGDGPMVLTASIVGTDLLLETAGVDLAVVTPGCIGGPGSISCALSAFTSLVIIGSDQEDSITLTPLSGHAFAITVLGRAGNDVLLGSSGNDALFGGEGDDIVLGEGGADLLSGGAGDNIVFFDGDDNPAGPEPVIEPLPGAQVPMPGGLPLLLGGLVALGIARRRHRAP